MHSPTVPLHSEFFGNAVHQTRFTFVGFASPIEHPRANVQASTPPDASPPDPLHSRASHRFHSYRCVTSVIRDVVAIRTWWCWREASFFPELSVVSVVQRTCRPTWLELSHKGAWRTWRSTPVHFSAIGRLVSSWCDRLVGLIFHTYSS